jgi:hypothetical protein
MKKLKFILPLALTVAMFCGKKEPKVFEHSGSAGWKTVKGIEIETVDKTISMKSSVKKPSSGGSTQGAYLVIPKEVAESFSGKKVQVTFQARSGESKPSKMIWAAYSTAEVGNSGWKKFELTNELKEYSFNYQVPKIKKGGVDFIGFNSDIEGKGRTAIVENIKIDSVK